ncbi:uncharacterized protein LOC119599443 [Penaeus monodon]|uniref:uncharacterized protein LOC119599443 n=1 Tax=Penaeus monodon TaxID=6687 RepID=UPI0018A77AE5|nr:uncharacterized protein LOC119599443 [Penaeus monodon]
MAPEAVPLVVVPEAHLRKLVKEVVSIPLVSSVTQKVSTTHEKLCSTVPLYDWLTATALLTTKVVASKAEEYAVVKTSVLKAEELGLHVVDNLKKNYPVIEKPTEEVVERTSVYVRQKIQLGKSRVASYSVSQATCRATEAAIKTAEVACDTLRIDRKENWLASIVPAPLRTLYNYTFGPALAKTTRQLRNGRRTVRALRRSGAVHTAVENRIKRRRKVSPRKSTKDQPSSGLWAWLISFLAVFGLASSPAHSSPAELPKLDRELTSSPKQQEGTTEDKKRKLSDVETEDATSVEEMSHLDLLHDMDDYRSDEDPDYSPSDTSTDSLEYRSTDHEESEAPFTEDDFKKEPTKASEGEPRSSGAAAPPGGESSQVTTKVSLTVVAPEDKPAEGDAPEVGKPAAEVE